MKMKPFRILRHAGTMAIKEIRSYALLSVTIVLSFSLLLGYLLWTDSSLYNTYKELFSLDRHIVTVEDEKLSSHAFSQALIEEASNYVQAYLQFDSAYFGSIKNAGGNLLTEDGCMLSSVPVCAVSVPRQAWCFYSNAWTKKEVIWLDGKNHETFHLNPGEILLDDRLYSLFNVAQKDNQFSVQLSDYHDAQGDLVLEIFAGTFKVVGILISGESLRFSETAEPYGTPIHLLYDSMPTIAFAAEDFNKAMYPKFEWNHPTLVFYSYTPENLEALIRSTGITANIDAVYSYQNAALERIRTEVDMKAIITTALLLILGINLYSSFCNALNDRRFEIGVKRALGASKWSIIRQFLYESLLVMLLNILLSIWLVSFVALAYKVIYEHIPDQFGNFYTFTLTLSPHSLGMFAACSLSLTVVFSLIFAYRATQVQIVDYLKAE